MYSDIYTKASVMIQIFEEDTYGIRLLFEDGTTKQYAERISMN